MKKIRVYFNLHKKMLSVQEKVNGSWKVVNCVEQIWLGDVAFKVSEAGRQRVLKQKRKNVHAYIEGIYKMPEITPFKHTPFVPVNYNPYKLEKFHDGKKYINKADFVYILGCRIYALNPQ
jgi:hypothetical protein